MNKLLAVVLSLASFGLSAPLQAELPLGAQAPVFSTRAALGGRVLAFNLRTALRRGPVVLYFYPKAFTQGCTLETRAFADAHDQFAAARATVIGLSADDLPTLQRFSTEECRSKFAVGVATPAIIRAYDVALVHPRIAGNVTSRTSYVISPDGRVRLVHSNMDYRDHVRQTLEAVQAMRRPR